MIRTPEDLIALYEGERSETDAMQAREDLLRMLETPGWKRIDAKIAADRDAAFEQLKHAKGAAAVIGEATLRWQMLDTIYEDLTHFIRSTIETADEIHQRRQISLDEALLKEQFHGRTDGDDLATGERFGSSHPDGADASGY